MNTINDFLIFYSWQSDLPAKTNLKAIRRALRVASSYVEESSEASVVLDEATRGESGSPNIPATILKKIAVSDVFICDLTTINSESGEQFRKTPNPNVLFELGYAVSLLGWGRIIMLFNKRFGKFPDDVPFDLDRQRVSPYFLSEQDPYNSSNISNLQSLLKTSIQAVVKSNPKRPAEVLEKSAEEIKRDRDVNKLSSALSTIHLPTIDEMILELPRCLNVKVLYFWESFRAVVCNSLFHLYDEKSSNLIRDIIKGWLGCLNHGEQYRTIQNRNLYIFSNPGDAPLNEAQEKAWNHINDSRALLLSSLDQLLGHIRKEYLEIDIDELNSNAWRAYVEYESQI